MSLDVTVLQLLKHREKYERLHRAIPKRAINVHTATVMDDFGRYYREFPEVQVIKREPFMLWFNLIHPKLPDTAVAVIDQVMRRVVDDPDEKVEAGLMERLVAAEAAVKIADIIGKWQEGDEIDLFAAMRTEVEAFEVQLDRKIKNPQVMDDIEGLLDAEEDDKGLHWRLPELNRHIKPLVGGDFIVVAARPDKGKTTFCASELTFMAPQVDQVYPDEKRSILWLNNEGPGKRIIVRNFQAALNCTVEQLVNLKNQPADAGFEKYRTQVRQQYAAALGGRPGVLRVMDIHGMWNHEVEDLIASYRPAVVLFDMIDNIKFGGGTNNNGERTDQLLESMYQWARMLAVKHDFAAIATSQISGDGDGLQYPTLSQLKDSRTGKQGAADVIITLGAVNGDSTLANSRYIGTTKNKKVRTGVPSSPNAEVRLDGDRARYVSFSQ